MSVTKNNNNQNLPTYLPYSEHCLTPQFLATENAVRTFVNLIKEAKDSQHSPSTRLPLAEILSGMPGLTAAQKSTAIETVKELEKKDARKKLGCQF